MNPAVPPPLLLEPITAVVYSPFSSTTGAARISGRAFSNENYGSKIRDIHPTKSCGKFGISKSFQELGLNTEHTEQAERGARGAALRLRPSLPLPSVYPSLHGKACRVLSPAAIPLGVLASFPTGRGVHPLASPGAPPDSHGACELAPAACPRIANIGCLHAASLPLLASSRWREHPAICGVGMHAGRRLPRLFRPSSYSRTQKQQHSLRTPSAFSSRRIQLQQLAGEER